MIMLRSHADVQCFLRAVPALQGVAVSTATCVQLHKRAEKIAAALTEKGSINTGENVVLLYPPGGFRLWSSCLHGCASAPDAGSCLCFR